MSVTIDFDIVGNRFEVERMLDHLDTCFSIGAMEKFLGLEIVPYLRERAGVRFDQEGDSASGRWKPLADTTVKIREAGIAAGQFSGISGSHPINVRTREMKDFIMGASGFVRQESRGNISLKWPGSAGPGVVQTKIRRAQTGGGTTVPRPVLAINQTDTIAVVSKLAHFIQSEGRF